MESKVTRTPITDAALGTGTNWHKPLNETCVPVAVARKLETDRATLIADLESITTDCDIIKNRIAATLRMVRA